MNYATIDLKELQEYATFSRQSEMDDVIYAHIERLRADEVPTSVIDVLLCLGRSSLRVLGVSFNRYETIANSIGKSKSTVIRAMRTLKQYGIIDAIPTLKRWGSYGKSRKKSVNIVRIMPCVPPQSDTAVQAEEATPNNESNVDTQSEPIIHNHYSSNTDETADTSAAVKRSLRRNVPSELFNALEPFFDGETLYKAIGTLYKAKASVNSAITFEDHADTYIDVFYATVRLYKVGKVRNLLAYLFTAWQSATSEICRRMHRNQLYDWLAS